MKQSAKRKKKLKLFDELKNSLQDAIAYERGRHPGLRIRELPLPPKPLSPREIRAIRQAFNVSQAVFARIINVSPNAVESWEQGVRRPREATLKLLSVAHKHPEILLSRD
jgi:putative transcriptional regulator